MQMATNLAAGPLSWQLADMSSVRRKNPGTAAIVRSLRVICGCSNLIVVESTNGASFKRQSFNRGLNG